MTKRSKKQVKGKRRGNKPIAVSSKRVTGMYLERSRFPSLPKEFEIALKYYYHDERTGGQTTQASRRNPLCEFDTQLPRYAAEFYQIYRHARIMAIDVRMNVVNTSSSEPLVAAIAALPLAVVNGITTPMTVASVPGHVFKQIGLSTGMSRAVLSRRFTTERELGELTMGSNTYLQTYSEALSSAIWTELPCIYSGVIAARTGATWTGIIDYELTYHLRFSELNIPSLGIQTLSAKSPPFYPSTQEMTEDDDEEWVEPPVLKRKKKAQPQMALSSSYLAK